MPYSQTVFSNFRQQRLDIRPAILAPRHTRVRRGRYCAQRCDLAAHLATSRCPRVSLRSCLQRCGPRWCAAPRCPKTLAPRALLANHSLNSPLAATRCPAGRSGPTYYLCPSPRHGALLCATLFSRCAPSHIALLARIAPVRRLQRCGPRCRAAPRRPMMPARRALFARRSPDSPPATPCCTAGRPRPTSSLRPWPAASRGAFVILPRAMPHRVARAACSNHKTFSRLSTGNALLSGRSLSPHVCVASCVRRPQRIWPGGLQRCGPRCCAVPRRPKIPAMRVQFANHAPALPPATPRCLPGRPRPTSSVRLSPAAYRGLVARGVAISPCAMPHRVIGAPRSGPAVCKDAARAVAPRRGVRRCPHSVFKSQTILPIPRWQRLVARLVALALRLC